MEVQRRLKSLVDFLQREDMGNVLISGYRPRLDKLQRPLPHRHPGTQGSPSSLKIDNAGVKRWCLRGSRRARPNPVRGGLQFLGHKARDIWLTSYYLALLCFFY